jgi:hypothetical protein
MCPDKGREYGGEVCVRVRDLCVRKGVTGEDLLLAFALSSASAFQSEPIQPSGNAYLPIGAPFPTLLKRKTFHRNLFVFTRAKECDIIEG